MIPSIRQSRFTQFIRSSYLVYFFIFLFLPLSIVAVFSFNDAPYPLPPWKGFTWDWFLPTERARETGLFLTGKFWIA